ncbi:MAG: zinc ribbon domain-containing protein [Opitutaceae bacterium]|nr:zinc ribbon domain-containing protein [Opitutaceae bacterium]
MGNWVWGGMATYIYETIPEKAGEAPRLCELVQSMREPAFTRHPETGERIRRVITGGFGLMGVSSGEKKEAGGGGCCGGGCRCGRC